MRQKEVERCHRTSDGTEQSRMEYDQSYQVSILPHRLLTAVL